MDLYSFEGAHVNGDDVVPDTAAAIAPRNDGQVSSVLEGSKDALLNSIGLCRGLRDAARRCKLASQPLVFLLSRNFGSCAVSFGSLVACRVKATITSGELKDGQSG